jgi:hypothetical protein
VVVTEQECNNLMVALQKQLGLHHATHALPVKCRGAIIDNAGKIGEGSSKQGDE